MTKQTLFSFALAVALVLPSTAPPSISVAATHAPPTPGSVIINEIHTANVSGLADSDNEYKDWIELVNTTAQPIDMSGVGLSNKTATPFKWVFPAGVVIPANGYLLVWASKKDRNVVGQPLHTNFNVDNGSDRVVMTAPGNITLENIASPLVKRDVSWCRVPNISGTFQHCANPSPNAANGGPSFASVLPAPVFSIQGGFYTSSQSVVITNTVAGSEIRYTLDGSEPKETSPLYTGPVTINNRVNAPNVYANIPSRPVDFVTPTTGEVYKGTVLRAAVFKSGSMSSTVTTHSYFVDPNVSNKYAGYPVISIAVDPPQFFSHDNPRGIYVPGPAALYTPEPPYRGANFWQDREVPIAVEYFKPDRSTAFRVDAGTDIAGAWSRSHVQKSLDLNFRDSYGTKNVTHQVFADKNITKFKRLRLRNGGTDFGFGQIRDQLGQYIIKDTGLAYGAWTPAVIFINGEYFGEIDVREKIDEDYIESNYGVNADFVDLLNKPIQNDGEISNGSDIKFHEMITFVRTSPVSVPTNYNTLRNTYMDVDNYAQYFAAYMFVNNTDWPENNVRVWRSQTIGAAPGDGKWRWILYDFDAAFYFDDEPLTLRWDNNMYQSTFNKLRLSDNPNEVINFKAARYLISELLKNTEFRTLYLNYTADQMNSIFKKQRMMTILNNMAAQIDPLMPEHFARWKPFYRDYADWQNNINMAREFIDRREAFHIAHTQTFFNLNGQYTLTLNANDVTMGNLVVNSLNLSNTLTTGSPIWQGRYWQNVPITVKAVAKPGYRFVNWQGASTSTQPSITLNLAANANLTAVFAPDTTNTPTPTNTPAPATPTNTPIPPTATNTPQASTPTPTATPAGNVCVSNLIANAGFESGLAGWENAGNLGLSNDARSGTNAATVGVGAGGFGKFIAVNAGQSLTLKTWAKKTSTDGAIGFSFFGPDLAVPIGAGDSRAVLNGVYTEYTLSGVAPAGASYMLVWGWKDSAGGLLFADDFCLTSGGSGPTPTPTATVSGPTATPTPLPPTSTPTATALPNTPTPSATPSSSVCAANLVLNAGFENNLSGWNVWDASTSITGNAPDVRSGGKALQMGPAAGGIGYHTSASPGQVFNFKAWSKRNQSDSGAQMGLNFFDSNWNQVGSVASREVTGATYQEYNLQATAPANTSIVMIWFYKSGPGFQFVDDVCLTR